jgi:hypothetical protein
MGSEKRTDLVIEVKNAARESEVKWVLEVGFSKAYNGLVDDTKLWLERRSEVSLVLLVNIKGTLEY